MRRKATKKKHTKREVYEQGRTVVWGSWNGWKIVITIASSPMCFFLLFASLQSVLLASAAVSTVIGAAIMVGRVGLSIAAACGVWVWFRSLTSRTVGGQLFGKVV